MDKEREQTASTIAELQAKVCVCVMMLSCVLLTFTFSRNVLCVNTLPYHPFVSPCILLDCYIVS